MSIAKRGNRNAAGHRGSAAISEGLRGNKRRLGIKHDDASKAKMRARRRLWLLSEGNLENWIASQKRGSIKGECAYCGEPAQTIDHVIPRCQGGADSPENLVPACWDCNLRKGPRTPEQWFSPSVAA